MKNLIFVALVVLAFSFAQSSTEVITVPMGNGAVLTVTSTPDAAQVKQTIDAVMLVISMFKGGVATMGVQSIILLIVLIFGIICSLIVLVIALTPTKKDDIFLNAKAIPFIVKWVHPIVKFLLSIKSKN